MQCHQPSSHALGHLEVVVGQTQHLHYLSHDVGHASACGVLHPSYACIQHTEASVPRCLFLISISQVWCSCQHALGKVLLDVVVAAANLI